MYDPVSAILAHLNASQAEKNAAERLEYWTVMLEGAKKGIIPDHDCKGVDGCQTCIDYETAKEELTSV